MPLPPFSFFFFPPLTFLSPPKQPTIRKTLQDNSHGLLQTEQLYVNPETKSFDFYRLLPHKIVLLIIYDIFGRDSMASVSIFFLS